MKTCSVTDCTGPHYAKGLCEKHYIRMRKGQDLEAKSVYQETDLERLQKKFTVADNGCWNWNFPRADGRANTFFYRGKPQAAYRAAYQILVGPVPDGMCLLHRCDNGLCVNPSHIFLGDRKDNYHDMVTKGRSNIARGEMKKTIAKLSDEIIREIRKSPLNGNQLAKKYGVHRQTIYDVRSGKAWAHVVD